MPREKFQIGVVGSAADLKYGQEVAAAAEEIGKLIALSGSILFFGAEKDTDSLSTAACRGAKKAGGLTVGVTYGKTKEIWEKDMVDVIIPTGLDRGGGREYILVLMCHALISISGGSGTLTELAVAYQAKIPMVALVGFGGWSDKLADTFMDAREAVKVVPAHTPAEAVNLAISLAREKS